MLLFHSIMSSGLAGVECGLVLNPRQATRCNSLYATRLVGLVIFLLCAICHDGQPIIETYVQLILKWHPVIALPLVQWFITGNNLLHSAGTGVICSRC
jgi:hypothetical protein